MREPDFRRGVKWWGGTPEEARDGARRQSNLRWLAFLHLAHNLLADRPAPGNVNVDAGIAATETLLDELGATRFDWALPGLYGWTSSKGTPAILPPEMRDWLIWLSGQRRKPNLVKLPYEEARVEARRWHTEIVQKQRALRGPVMPRFETILRAFPAGWTVRTTEDRKALGEVGAALGHCYRDDRGDSATRDHYFNNYLMAVGFDPAGQPHFTIAFDVMQPDETIKLQPRSILDVVQARGGQNTLIKAAYHKYVRGLLMGQGRGVILPAWTHQPDWRWGEALIAVTPDEFIGVVREAAVDKESLWDVADEIEETWPFGPISEALRTLDRVAQLESYEVEDGAVTAVFPPPPRWDEFVEMAEISAANDAAAELMPELQEAGIEWWQVEEAAAEINVPEISSDFFWEDGYLVWAQDLAWVTENRLRILRVEDVQDAALRAKNEFEGRPQELYDLRSQAYYKAAEELLGAAGSGQRARRNRGRRNRRGWTRSRR